ncbi:TIR-like protein FxsC [Parafrankia sp. BMG5.11]|uniref:TIR-like protein FxsC n=1 Tax=Parafrankia sp. BMG5.11 TaxID=222540 RepID=UPI00103E7683|nr:TIR-like protein FxsC [Parafrankia sp. BMG5.11]TCJ34224.1 TIR domain-containing protein [Parafrankia sp. BMG5.11]
MRRHRLAPAGMPEAWSARPLYFFFSYARADSRDDPLLEQFFRDLRDEVRRRVGDPDPNTVGFLDLRSIQPGEAWSAELGAALCRCRTFVAMCSPSFFASEYCGREWGMFDGRLRSAAASGQVPAALLPVIWTPLRDPPEPLARLQYDHSALGKAYTKFGLRYLMQLKRNHDEYQEFVLTLAARIVQLADDSPLTAEPEIPALHQVPDAFRLLAGPPTIPDQEDPPPEIPAAVASGPLRVDPVEDEVLGSGESGESRTSPDPPRPPAPPSVPPATPGPVAGGPGHVTFVLASTSAEEIAALRRQLDCYGDTFEEWTPYKPRDHDRVCVIAQMVAARQKLISKIVPLDHGVSDLLERSRERNEIVILIVDMWAAKLANVHQALVTYDVRNEPTSGVLVPANPHDTETHANSAQLIAVLATALRNNFVRRDKLFRMNVRSCEEFDLALVQIIVESQARIFEYRQALRSTGDNPRRFPRLNGP